MATLLMKVLRVDRMAARVFASLDAHNGLARQTGCRRAPAVSLEPLNELDLERRSRDGSASKKYDVPQAPLEGHHVESSQER
jgi:hypothetical protein